VKRELVALLVVFARDGEEPTSRHASGGEQACLFARTSVDRLPGAAGRRPLNGAGGDERLSNQVH
jgi:hypothetical protein